MNVLYKFINKMSIWTIVLIIVVVLFLVFWFASKQKNNNQSNGLNLPISNVDLTKYQGTWYEVARLPTMFQRGCTNTTATYTLNANKTISVTNQCQIGNRMVRVDGIAYPNYPETSPNSNIYPGSFTVVFNNNNMIPTAPQSGDENRGDYNVILVDPQYQYALVGTNNRDNLWFLSRTRNMDQTTYNYYSNIARELGYPVNKLEFN
ncbi:putative lipocalin [Tupanvirus deep ocean]|uniref:Lipocalin n=2 Tax=Tupanvirus TaxID=2094720 RepID=A0AC62A9Z1_9VIRU|nr:putative lipocalin [Tupanvirus deep ocean]QKU34497.1 putative lipocalin [Tupanvirus deep ocean]